MAEARYSDSHLYTILVKKGDLHVIPDEFDRVKKSVSYRIMCIVDGECQLFLSGESHRLSKNDICFLRPGDVYRTLPIQKMRALNIYFTFDRGDLERLADANTIDQSNVAECHTISDLPLLNRPFVIKNYAEGVRLALEMSEDIPQDAALAQKKRDVILEMLMLRLAAHYEHTESFRREDKQHCFMSAITAFIVDNIHEAITCERIAKHFNYHPNYLNEAVKRATGMSLHRYILEQKIKGVTEELIVTEKSIAQIAQDYAFCDSSHLTRSHFRVTHLCPSDVRKAARR